MVTLMSCSLHSSLLLVSCMSIPVCSYVCTNTQAHSVYEPKTESYEYWLSLDIMATGLSSGFRV